MDRFDFRDGNLQKLRFLTLNVFLRGALVATLIYAVALTLTIYVTEAVDLALLTVPAFILILSRYLSGNLQYRCPKCNFEFRISLLETLLTLHQTYFRLLRCPKCSEVSWCRIVKYRGQEVVVKAKQIEEKSRTNHRQILFLMVAVYAVYVMIWFLKPVFVIFAAVTAFFAYFAAVVLYAYKNKYNSAMYNIVSFVVVFLVGIMVFVQILLILAG